MLCSRAHLQPSELEVKTMVAQRPWRRHALGLSHRHLSDHFAVLARMTFDRPASTPRRSTALDAQDEQHASWLAMSLAESPA